MPLTTGLEAAMKFEAEDDGDLIRQSVSQMQRPVLPNAHKAIDLK
jgi:hypothetical protein